MVDDSIHYVVRSTYVLYFLPLAAEGQTRSLWSTIINQVHITVAKKKRRSSIDGQGARKEAARQGKTVKPGGGEPVPEGAAADGAPPHGLRDDPAEAEPQLRGEHPQPQPRLAAACCFAGGGGGGAAGGGGPPTQHAGCPAVEHQAYPHGHRDGVDPVQRPRPEPEPLGGEQPRHVSPLTSLWLSRFYIVWHPSMPINNMPYCRAYGWDLRPKKKKNRHHPRDD